MHILKIKYINYPDPRYYYNVIKLTSDPNFWVTERSFTEQWQPSGKDVRVKLQQEEKRWEEEKEQMLTNRDTTPACLEHGEEQK